jgi:hypothetical protein
MFIPELLNISRRGFPTYHITSEHDGQYFFPIYVVCSMEAVNILYIFKTVSVKIIVCYTHRSFKH